MSAKHARQNHDLASLTLKVLKKEDIPQNPNSVNSSSTLGRFSSSSSTHHPHWQFSIHRHLLPLPHLTYPLEPEGGDLVRVDVIDPSTGEGQRNHEDEAKSIVI